LTSQNFSAYILRYIYAEQCAICAHARRDRLSMDWIRKVRNADMITFIVHDRESGVPFRVDLELIAHLLRKPPQVLSRPLPGKRTLIFAMSREEWEREFPTESSAST
jgi:hypothetical protein